MARLCGIFIGTERGADKLAVTSAELLVDHGLRGDAHAGGSEKHPQRHVSLFAQEVLSAIQTEGFAVQPGALSANLFTEGVELDALPLGTQLRIGAVVLEIVEARQTCRSITRIDYRLTKRLVGECGVFACVSQGGTVQVGEPIEIVFTT